MAPRPGPPLGGAVAILLLLLLAPGAARAQRSVADLLGRPATPDGEPKTYLEELTLYSYIENSFVGNLRTTGRGDVNELRFYDHDNGYTFNAAELSLKKDPSERFRLGYGVVVTAGLDSQKNHSVGIFRDRDDQGPFFRNTEKFDLPEAYASFLVPVGNGLTLKAGKWATLIGYEGYESPKNLNFSRDVLYTLGTPNTHTGALASYPVLKWLAVTLGFTNGWDAADNNNDYLRAIGQAPSPRPTSSRSPRASTWAPSRTGARCAAGSTIAGSWAPRSSTSESTSSRSRSTSTSRERRTTQRWSRWGLAPTMTPAGVASPVTWRMTGRRPSARCCAPSISATPRASGAARRLPRGTMSIW